MTENLLPQIIQDMRKKTLAQFQIAYTGWYLFGGPTQGEDSDISFKTDVISPEEFSRLVKEQQRADSAAPFTSDTDGIELADCFVYEIRKKPGSAFSQWITIGRALNNDIVLRFPTVSKLHARLEIETTAFGDPLGYHLIDNHSTGKTVHNGELLAADKLISIAIGDIILFGNIRCTVMDGTLFWKQLR